MQLVLRKKHQAVLFEEAESLIELTNASLESGHATASTALRRLNGFTLTFGVT
jgi:hypothetical protein